MVSTAQPLFVIEWDIVLSMKRQRIARGLACDRLRVLRQWFNRLVCSCLIVKNMFVKLKTKRCIVSKRFLMSYSRRFLELQRSPMTSHCLCLREERIVRCFSVRIVNFFLSDMKKKWNLDNLNVSSIGYIGLYHNSSRGHHGMHLHFEPFLLQNYLLMVLFLRQT